MRTSPLKQETCCKVCGHTATPDTLVDFNKYCDFDHPDRALLPLSGIPVWYHRCEHCGLIFTEAFDDWDVGEFREHIYNDSYEAVDPEYRTERPRRTLAWLRQNVQGLSGDTHLDYGGGEGYLSDIIRPFVRSSCSWDPFVDSVKPAENAVFSLVTAFEVIEHSPAPAETARHMLSLLDAGGELILSTVTHSHPERDISNRWYISPRNGHVTIYSDYALDLLFGPEVLIEHYHHCFHRIRKPL